jgi:flagellar biosynthesis regulator FlbT
VSQLRAAVAAFGWLPALLVIAGVVMPSKYSKALMVIGGLWGLANALFAVREVSATVTAGEPTITYRSSDSSEAAAP